jgi:hypothetical protein
MTEDEIQRSLELKDMFVTTPAFKSIYQSIKYEYPDIVSIRVPRPYVSSNEKPLTKEEVKDYLTETGVLDKVEDSFAGGIL